MKLLISVINCGLMNINQHFFHSLSTCFQHQMMANFDPSYSQCFTFCFITQNNNQL